MNKRRRLPDAPVALVYETTELLTTLESTVANLREFTERLRTATAAEAEPRKGDQ